MLQSPEAVVSWRRLYTAGSECTFSPGPAEVDEAVWSGVCGAHRRRGRPQGPDRAGALQGRGERGGPGSPRGARLPPGAAESLGLVPG